MLGDYSVFHIVYVIKFLPYLPLLSLHNSVHNAFIVAEIIVAGKKVGHHQDIDIVTLNCATEFLWLNLTLLDFSCNQVEIYLFISVLLLNICYESQQILTTYCHLFSSRSNNFAFKWYIAPSRHWLPTTNK